MEFRVTIYKVDTPALSTLVFLNGGKCSQVCMETFIKKIEHTDLCLPLSGGF